MSDIKLEGTMSNTPSQMAAHARTLGDVIQKLERENAALRDGIHKLREECAQEKIGVNAPWAAPGFTKREAFAMAALPGWIEALGRRHAMPGYEDRAIAAEAARRSVEAADALIAMLNENRERTTP